MSEWLDSLPWEEFYTMPWDEWVETFISRPEGEDLWSNEALGIRCRNCP